MTSTGQMFRPKQERKCARTYPLFAAPRVFANGQSERPACTSSDPPPRSAITGQVQIPNRPSNSLFIGQQGKQRTEIHFDPATGLVTLRLLVQDLNGYFIPDLRRDNFVGYVTSGRPCHCGDRTCACIAGVGV
jgi:hypothetical protein